MNRKNIVRLGINHQFIFPEAISVPDVHTKTLEILAGDSRFDALDFWIGAKTPNREKEMKIIQSSGKYLNYNIGDRYGQRVMIPASPEKEERDYALGVIKREIGMALECGANKIIFGSGPDFPNNREEAKKRLAGFILEAFREVPQNIPVTLEPTGRDMDKFFLLGPFDESAEFAEQLRIQGMKNFALLIDMGHIPLLGVSIEKALDQSKGYIGHIHLGNCIVKDKAHPLYGDNHVPWGIEGGEYGENEVGIFLRSLADAGYFSSPLPCTISFEMRPYKNLGFEGSTEKFLGIFKDAWETIT